MPVYVDDMAAPFGRMIMCHMLADTTDELLAMADKIGVQRKWLQAAGTPREHFDISAGKRALALRCGAQEITWKEAGAIVSRRRKEQESGSRAVCRLCGKGALEIQGWLTRVNPPGEVGIWECRPACGATLTPDERVLGAIEG